MLSATPIRNLDYYADLASEDYYHAGGEPPGQWAGAGAAEFGLSGRVSDLAYRRIFSGRHPLTGEFLAQKQGDDEHRPGWDFSFSAPKSVSLVWSQTNSDALRHDIQQAHDAAMRAGLAHLEKYAYTRRGHGGKEQEPVKLIAATFEHGTSRAQDPQLHTHTLIANICRRADGTYGTIESIEMFRAKMAAGAIYQAELAARMQALGFAVEQDDKGTFRVAGSPRDLEAEFSKRREAIERAMEEHKTSGARAAEIAALDTREKKDPPAARADLFKQWQADGAAHNYDEEAVRAATGAPIPEMPSHAQIMRGLTENLSVVTEHQIFRAVAVAAQGRLDAAGISAHVADLLASPDVVHLRREGDGAIRYSTREMVEIEAGLGASAAGRRGEGKHPVAIEIIAAACGRGTPSEQQRAVIEQIVGGPDGVTCVQGMAGAGKSYVMGICREAWADAGYHVIGAALAGKAAAGLEEEAKIDSSTIHRLIYDLDNGTQKLTAKTVLVIDEAGMVGSRQMADVLARCEAAGAKLVLTGDTDQLQPVSAGGAFRAIQEQTGALKIDEIRRQREAEDRRDKSVQDAEKKLPNWAVRAVHAFAAGQAVDALAAYHEQGRLHVDEDRAGTIGRLVDDWAKNRDPLKPENSLIIASLNADAAQLNREARERIRPSLGAGGVTTVTGRDGNTRPLEIREGDRLCFGKNAKVFDPLTKAKQPIKNGQLSTVETMVPGRKPGEWIITAKIDGGKSVRFSTAEYTDIAHGYAVTTYKSQGVTVDKTYVMGTTAMASRENIYVQMSRHRKSADLYLNRKDFDTLTQKTLIENTFNKHLEASKQEQSLIESIEPLAKKYSRENKKETTLDFVVQKSRTTIDITED